MAISAKQPMRPAEIELVKASNEHASAISDEVERAKEEERRIEGKLDGIAILQGTAPTDPNGEDNPSTQTAVVLDCVREGDGEWGPDNLATEIFALAEGWGTQATGNAAHAEGRRTKASGNDAHAEGNATEASSQHTHAEGWNTHATNVCAHAEGNGCTASGANAHAEGNGCTASGANAHVQGKFNSTAKANLAHIVGGGSSESDRKNIHEIDWDGNGWYLGDVKCGDATGTAGVASLREAYDHRLTKGSVTTEMLGQAAVNASKIANGAVTMGKLDSAIQTLLQSIPSIDFGSSDAIDVPASSHATVDVTFNSPKTETPLIFCSIRQIDDATALLANVQDVTNANASIVITNPYGTDVPDVTLDWLAVSGR